MLGEDLEAGNNLRNLSQRTSYILDWNQPLPYSLRYQQSIPEQRETPEHPELPLIRKSRTIQKETSEKYDLKKCEKKLKTIDEPIFALQRALENSKKGLGQAKQQSSPEIFKQKHSKSVPWLRPIEAEYLRRQVQVFKRKNSDSQKDLQARLAIHNRHKRPLLSLNAKLRKQPDKRGRVMVVSEEEIDQIKRIIAKGSKGEHRNSIAYLLEEECLPAIKAFH